MCGQNVDTKEGAKHKKGRNSEALRPGKYLNFAFLVAGAGFTQDPTIVKWV